MSSNEKSAIKERTDLTWREKKRKLKKLNKKKQKRKQQLQQQQQQSQNTNNTVNTISDEPPRKRQKTSQAASTKTKSNANSNANSQDTLIENKHSKFSQNQIDLLLNEVCSNHNKIPYDIDKDKNILLLGEGDFSFAASLSKMGFCGDNNTIIATSFEISHATLIKKYINSKYNLNIIQQLKNECIFNVDIFKLNSINNLFKYKGKIDKIIFNFPHCGIPNYQISESISKNQVLLRAIFDQTIKFANIKDNNSILNSELHITLKSEPIYNSWDIQKQCKMAANQILENKNNNNKNKTDDSKEKEKEKEMELKQNKNKSKKKKDEKKVYYWRLKKRIPFDSNLYFGYSHSKTNTHKNKNRTMVSSNDSFTWIFGVGEIGVQYDNISYNKGEMFQIGMFKCNICNEQYNSEKRFGMHMQSKRHLANVAKHNLAQKLLSLTQEISNQNPTIIDKHKHNQKQKPLTKGNKSSQFQTTNTTEKNL